MSKIDKYLVEEKEDIQEVDVLDRIEIEELIVETKEMLEDEELCEKAIDLNWGKESIKKFGDTIGKGPDQEGFVNTCIMRMKGKKGWDKDKAGGFCTGLVDKFKGSTEWRKGPRK